MNRNDVEKLTSDLLAGRLAQADFVTALASLSSLGTGLPTPPMAELGDTTLDLDRQRRCGFSEVVFGQSKTVESLARIFRRLLDENQPVLATRVDTDKATDLLQQFPAGRYNAAARTFRINVGPGRRTGPNATNKSNHSEQNSNDQPAPTGLVAIVTAGTTDIPVAEEVRETADWMGANTDLIVDVGVAGPQRLLAKLDRITKADAVVVVAGMEAALASVVGGHVACPVIAVPTSIGYGANFGGLAALLGMLNSCAANVAVVNIDAGFKAGYIAGMIAVRKHLE